jgi:hypothetical protein
MKELKISPSYLLRLEIEEFLTKLKVKMIAHYDDPSELYELYKILKHFNSDIQDDILYNLDNDVIRDIKLNSLLNE